MTKLKGTTSRQVHSHVEGILNKEGLLKLVTESLLVATEGLLVGTECLLVASTTSVTSSEGLLKLVTESLLVATEGLLVGTECLLVALPSSAWRRQKLSLMSLRLLCSDVEHGEAQTAFFRVESEVMLAASAAMSPPIVGCKRQKTKIGSHTDHAKSSLNSRTYRG